MRIQKISIEHFGKLSGVTLEPESGLNLIYGANEEGKTTLMAFLKMMFYGDKSRTGDVSRNMRRRYQPWDGSPMGGAVEFEQGGIHYRLERQFGKSNSTDRILLYRGDTGGSETLSGGEAPGTRFFGMSSETFERTVFIGQTGAIPGVDAQDEITAKLTNLVSAGDETVSAKQVDTRLNAAIEQLVSKRKKTGLLDKLYETRQDLFEQHRQALEREKQLVLYQQQLEQQREEYRKRTQEKKKLEDRVTVQQKLSQLSRLRSAIERQEALDQLNAQLRSYQQQLTGDHVVVEEDYLEEYRQLKQRLSTGETLVRQREKDLESLAPEQTSLQPRQASRQDLERLTGLLDQRTLVSSRLDQLELEQKAALEQQRLENEIQKIAGQRQNILAQQQQQMEDSSKLRQTITKNQQTLEEMTGKWEAAQKELEEKQENLKLAHSDYQVALHNTASIAKLSEQKLLSAQQNLNLASEEKKVKQEFRVRRRLNKAMFISALVVAAVSVVLGLLVTPYVFSGLAVAVLLLVLSFERERVRSTATTMVDEQQMDDAYHQYDDVLSEIRVDQEIARQQQAKAKTVYETLETGIREVQANVEHWQKETESLQQQGESLHNRLHTQELELEFLQRHLADLEQRRQQYAVLLEQIPNRTQSTLPQLERRHQELEQEMQRLQRQADWTLSRFGCTSLDEMQAAVIQAEASRAAQSTREETYEALVSGMEEAREQVNELQQQILWLAGRFHGVETLEQADRQMERLEGILEAASEVQTKLQSLQGLEQSDYAGMTVAGMVEQKAQLSQQIQLLSTEKEPASLSEEELERLRRRAQQAGEEAQQCRESAALLQQECVQLSKLESPAQLDNRLSQIQGQIRELENRLNSLELARSVLSQAEGEMRQSFGPLLNQKTGELLKRLTGGKYDRVLISKNLELSVQENQSVMSRPWQSLSSGTVDQSYLALRLAISELLDEKNLPVLLDDVLIQYDDRRTRLAVEFLADYSRQRQVLFFTCHGQLIKQFRQHSRKVKVCAIGRAEN